MKISAFAGRDNAEKFKVKLDNQPFNFDTAGVTSVQAVAGSAVITSASGDISIEGDVLSVKFGKFDLQAGFYQAQIVIYSALYPNGLVIAGPGLSVEIDLTMADHV